MSRTRAWWDELVSRASPPAVESPPFEDVAVRTGRDRAVDALVCLLGAVSGALFLSPELDGAGRILTTSDVLVDVGCGLLACAALWWRRRWPLGVALGCLVLGTLSISATAPGLVALFSLAVHRPARPAVLATALWVPSVVLFAVYSPTTDPVTVVAVATPAGAGAPRPGPV